MKTTTSNLLAGLVLLAMPVFAQSIDVKPSGVDIGAAATGATGALIKQEGSEVSILHKDGVNPPELRVIVTDEGNVGIGVAAPVEKLEVDGSVAVTADLIAGGSATVGSLVVGTSTIFTEGYFESAEMAIPDNNVTISVAHGMSARPRFVTTVLRCVSSDYGWAVGDEIQLSSIHTNGSNYGFTTAVNATHFKLRRNNNITIHRLDSSGSTALNTSNWRLVFRAWR